MVFPFSGVHSSRPSWLIPRVRRSLWPLASFVSSWSTLEIWSRFLDLAARNLTVCTLILLSASTLPLTRLNSGMFAIFRSGTILSVDMFPLAMSSWLSVLPKRWSPTCLRNWSLPLRMFALLSDSILLFRLLLRWLCPTVSSRLNWFFECAL